MSKREQIIEKIDPLILELGFDLEDIQIISAGKHSIIQVLVDKDGGINLDEVAKISNAISEYFDNENLLEDKPYTLDVGSPGVDRALTLPRHWRRNKDRLVKIIQGSNSFIGRILENDDNQVSIDIKGKTQVFEFVKISSAQVQVEFNKR
jgi:ribosome maturation factor RimP